MKRCYRINLLSLICLFSLTLVWSAFAFSQTNSVCKTSVKHEWQSKQVLNGPESVVYEPQSKTLLISNVNGQATDKDGNGTIPQLNLKGEMLNPEWATGLDAPKGMAIFGSTLFVADIDRVVAIDISNGKKQIYRVKKALFLNDVAVDKQGVVYSSYMMTDTIYRLRGSRLEKWLQNEKLMGPNGLLVQDDNLYVASWGKLTEGFNTSESGHVIKVSLHDKSITSLGCGAPLGNLDGLEPAPCGGFWVTDFMAGTLMQIDSQGKVIQTIKLSQSSADLTTISLEGKNEGQLLVIPMMNNGIIHAFKSTR